MRFKLTPRFLLFAVLCVCLTSGELWLREALAAQQSRIVFTSLRDGNNEIYVMDADGGNQENLTNNPANDFDPDWSPDGTKIASSSARGGDRRQIYVMDADGSQPKKLTDTRDNTDPDWSPDGQKIAFTVHPDFKEEWLDHIAVVDSDGNNRVRHEDHAMDPSWSPDGGAIAFVSWRDVGNRAGGNEIYVIGADRQGRKRVTHDLVGQHSPSFSPDGGRIAYYASHEGFNHIYVVGADGRNRKRLTHNQKHHSHPAWSPDGGAIAYMISNDIFFGGATIHLMTADGKYLTQLGDVHDGEDFQPDFSPVGLAVSPTSKTAATWGRLKKSASNVR